MYSKIVHRVIAAAAMILASVQAAPTEVGSELATQAAGDVSILVDGRFYMCVDANFVERIPGLCLNHPFNAGECRNLGNPFFKAVSSLGPDGGWNCIVYKNLDCGGDSLLVTKAGTIFDMSKIPGWNDQISSFRCRRQ